MRDTWNGERSVYQRGEGVTWNGECGEAVAAEVRMLVLPQHERRLG